MASSYAELVASALQQLMWKNPLCRQTIRACDASYSFQETLPQPHAVIEQILTEYLPNILSQLHAQDILPQPCLIGDKSCGLMEEKDDVDGSDDGEDSDDNDEEKEDDKHVENSVDVEDSDDDEEDEEDEVKLMILTNDGLGQEFIGSLDLGSYNYKVNPLSTLINCVTECEEQYPGYSLEARVYGKLARTCSSPLTVRVDRQGEEMTVASYYTWLAPLTSAQKHTKILIYSVHCSYGNDNMESVCQGYFALDHEYHWFLQEIVEGKVGKLGKEKNNRYFTWEDLRKRGLDNIPVTLAQHIVYTLHRIGLLTIVS